MKKILSTVFLIAIFIISNKVAAEEIFIGNFKDGCEVFLLTDTVEIKNRDIYEFSCKVRAGESFIKYYFYPVKGRVFCTNSNGYRYFTDNGPSPIVPKLYNYVISHWRNFYD